MAFELSRFQFWLTSVLGAYIDVDRFAGAQCWDLHAHFADFFGLPVINTTGGSGRWAGYAGTMYRDYPQTKAIRASYVQVPPTERAKPGDQAIWGDSFWYYPATHVAVVIEDRGYEYIRCASQNSSESRWDNPFPGQSSGPVLDQWLPKQGLLGYLRPAESLVLQGQIITPKEDTLSAEEVRQINDHTTLMLNQIALDGQLGGRTRGGMADVADKVGDVWTWLRGGESGKRVAGPIPAMLAGIQGQNAGLLEAVKQLASKPGSPVDLAAVEQAAKAGAASALADLQATATTTVTLSQEG
ncbi:hypothetical protein ARZXY2_2524 [Arthrobacter sp. ZXY-2]|nr:hypothetical protein ARZXY2_2524 [Arthrobacter sp. ZXY-2]